MCRAVLLVVSLSDQTCCHSLTCAPCLATGVSLGLCTEGLQCKHPFLFFFFLYPVAADIVSWKGSIYAGRRYIFEHMPNPSSRRVWRLRACPRREVHAFGSLDDDPCAEARPVNGWAWLEVEFYRKLVHLEMRHST